ncbi:hypothetical protein ONZ45_g11347 [Pleurotus djamor]|nr:hypothetical protein ONZ45_g11347 [Pleurotus djamor]
MPAVKAPLDPSIYAISPEASAFFKAVTGIRDDEELKTHILKVQRSAYEICGYPCIRLLLFLDLYISRHTIYPQVMQLPKVRPGAILLDIGCCFGNDIRKAVMDGWPVESAIASDLRGEFWNSGHELFKSTPESFPAAFVQGDIFTPQHIAPREPFYEAPTAQVPKLSTLSNLTPLQGHVAALHANSFIHLFDEATQTQVCKILASLLSPLPGSTIFGTHGGLREAGNKKLLTDGEEYDMYWHSPESWAELWDGGIFKKGTAKVEARLELASEDIQKNHCDSEAYIMVCHRREHYLPTYGFLLGSILFTVMPGNYSSNSTLPTANTILKNTHNIMAKFTPDYQLDLFFPPALISEDVKKQLHPSLHIRPLASTDYQRGYLDVLRVLTVATDPGEMAWVAQFNTMRSAPRTYYPLVILDKASDKIVAVGNVFIERKFLRGLGSVGHIEDIAVDKSQQGKKLGLRVIHALTYISENSGCYKTILNCSDDNIPFYQKCGFAKKENEMAKYAPEKSTPTSKL